MRTTRAFLSRATAARCCIPVLLAATIVAALAGAGCRTSRAPADPAPSDRSADESEASAAPAREVQPINGRVEVHSDYSHIVVGEEGTERTLYFVRDSGEIVVESRVDVARRHELLVPYTRTMFASYLFVDDPEHVLIVGLGGGAMVHFLEHYDPDLAVDAVEIDPAIVEIAHDYFGVTDTETVDIITEDAFVYLQEPTDPPWDVIYMDAFLKPSEDTDETGVPLNMQTMLFYEQLQTHLADEGMVVFNLNWSRELEQDIQTIYEAFGHTYVFNVPGSGNYIVVATVGIEPVAQDELRRRGAALDERFGTSFSFEEMARHAELR